MCLTQKISSQRSSSTRFILMVSHDTAGLTVQTVQAAWLACVITRQAHHLQLPPVLTLQRHPWETLTGLSACLESRYGSCVLV
jgi:hypothetical protein